MSEQTLGLIVSWVAAICTFGIYSVLYRENKVYRFFEHVFIGVGLGWGLFLIWRDVLKPMWWDAMTKMGEVVVTDIEQPTWKGGTLDKKLLPPLKKEEKSEASIAWDTTKAPTLTTIPDASNWINCYFVTIWVHSPRKTDEQVAIVVVSDRLETKEEDVLWYPITLNFAGWRQVRIYAHQFWRVGNPVGLKRVEELRFTTKRPFVTKPFKGKLHLDRIQSFAGRRWYWAFALVVGLMFYGVYFPRYQWMNRMALGFLMGLGSGLGIKGFMLQVFPQVTASFKPLNTFNNIVFMVTLICVMVYFFFSFEHRHSFVRNSARLGRWALMICFGVIFGNTIMGRLSLFIDRLQFLYNDWYREALVEPLLKLFL